MADIFCSLDGVRSPEHATNTGWQPQPYTAQMFAQCSLTHHPENLTMNYPLNLLASPLGRGLAHVLAACALLAAGTVQAQTYINATVGGEMAPGVYGRINIGSGMPPPPVIYTEPVIIQRPAVVVPRSPIYLYVPPGHAKNWGKHCHRYNACAQPVYFVQEPPPRRGPPHRGHHGRDDRRWDDDHRHGGKHPHRPGRHDRHDRHDREDHRGRGDGRGPGHHR